MQLPVVEHSDPLQELQTLVRGAVRTSVHERQLYATDASPYQVMPLAVVEPLDADDVRAAVHWCAANGLPVLARGGGTSLAGQTVNRAVVIDCSVHMTTIEIQAHSRTATVGPGVVLDDLREAARPHGLTFGAEVSTSAQATLGGMVANNSAGLHSLWWGMTGDHVRALDVVLADGTQLRLEAGSSDPRVQVLVADIVRITRDVEPQVRSTFPAVMRNNGGYRLDLVLDQLEASSPDTLDAVNPARVVCGSEGTLAFITGIELDLVPIPKHVGLAVLGFTDVASALARMMDILQIEPSAVELLDDDVITRARAHEAFAGLVDLLPQVDGDDPEAVLYVDCFADTVDALQAKLDALRALGEPLVVASTEQEQKDLWYLRKVGLGLISGDWSPVRPVPGLEDCAVPVEHLASFQDAFTAMLQAHGLKATWYAHASVGLLHARPRLDLHDEQSRHTYLELGRSALDLVRQFGGSISGEHGDGRIRAALVHEFYGPQIVDAFGRIKTLFDPSGRFNPGMIVEATPSMAALRIDEEQDIASIDTFFHWETEGGLPAAAAQCNGQGLCRRSSGGAMCPSFRATREERHSTRGRGNALRLAITGQVAAGEAAFDDPDTVDTLGLCLGCKACRYECPSQVDVTKLKAEYDAQRWRRRGGVPWRTRLKASVRRFNRLGSAVYPMVNLMQRAWPIAGVLKRVLGVAPSRSLPKLAPSLGRWMRDRSSVDGPTVLLYPDCFTMWNDPDIGKAAVGVLEAFGYRVELLEQADCCGRTACSAGVLDMAVQQVRRSSAAVTDRLASGDAVGIVTVEPSCATAMQQEWAELNTGVDVSSITTMAHTVESFLVDHWDDHPCTPKFETYTKHVMVHVHCHQKHRASVVEAVLRRCGCEDVELLDSGCCGMAGSFGYDAQTHDLSLRIARQSLGEAMARAHSSTIVAHGTSCRHQINDVFDTQAIHPMVLLHSLVSR
ncbi:MAG: FAD-binding oxidoreductase [Phycisphaerales bacterium]|nr:FAD-binding oxidoreductase [Phycisphaerales bacterium]